MSWPFELRDTHERLDGAVGGQAAAEEQEAVARKQALQELRQRKVEMDVPVVAVGGVVLGLVEHPLGGVVEVAVELQQVALAGGNGAEEGAGLASAGDLLDEGLGVVLVDLFEHTVEVGGDSGTVEELRQQRHGASDVIRRLEVALEVEVEAVLAERWHEVVHHAFVVAVLFETVAHGVASRLRVIAEIEQVLFPLRTSGALGHAGADEGNDEAALAGALEFVEARQIARKLVGVEDASFLLLIEALRFLIVEVAVAEVEGAAGLGERDFLVAALADDLDVLELLVVDDFVEAAVLADAGEFFERGFVVERMAVTDSA